MKVHIAMPRIIICALLALTSAACHGLKDTPMPLEPTFVGGSLTATANPPMVFFGGSSTVVTTRVLNAIGGAFQGQTVRFATTNGTVSPVTATTDANGQASTTLTAGSTARVTATVDTLSPATVDVDAQAPFSVRVEVVRPIASSLSVLTWMPIVTVMPASGAVNVPGPSSVEVNCGTGAPTETRQGFVGDQPFTCIASSAGTYETRVTARTSGFVTQATASVSIAPALPPFNIELSVSGPPSGPPTNGAKAVSFTVRVSPDTRLAASYEYDFGDGTKTGEISNFTQTHLYTAPGSYTAIVSVKSTDGRNLKAAKIVDVTF